MDEVGRVVWYHRPVRTAGDVRRLRNGNLLYSSDVDGARGTLVEIDMLGNIVQQWYSRSVAKTGFHEGTFVDTDTFHHDVLELPTGNLLVWSTELRTYERYPSSDRDATAPPVTQDVVGDVLVEFARDGTILRRWHLLDLLDPYRIGFGSLDTNFWRRTYEKLMEQPKVADWAHGNALSYDTQDQSILVSARHQDATVKIDLASGKVVWILAPHEGWKEPWRSLLLQPAGEVQWAYHAHGTEVTPQRTLLMFDNGNERATPFAEPLPEDKRFSRAVESPLHICVRSTVVTSEPLEPFEPRRMYASIYHMKRTTMFLDEGLERDLRTIARRRRQSFAAVVREAMASYVTRQQRRTTRALRFEAVGRSGRRDVAEHHEDLLWPEPHEDRRPSAGRTAAARRSSRSR